MSTTPCVLVGAGERACRVLLPALADSGFSVTTVVDSDESTYHRFVDACRRNGLASPHRFEATVPTALGESWAIIATPHATHADLTLALLSQVDFVMKEKPLASSLKDARRLENVQHRIHLLVDRPYSEEFAWIVREIPSIAPVQSYVSKYMRSSGDYISTWRNNKELAGGGVVIDMGYHILDMTVRLFGPVSSASWWRNSASLSRQGYLVEEWADLAIQHRSGVAGRMQLSRVSDDETEEHHFNGKYGTISLDDGQARLSAVHKNDAMSFQRNSVARATRSIRYGRDQLERNRHLGEPTNGRPGHEMHVMEIVAELYSRMPNGDRYID